MYGARVTTWYRNVAPGCDGQVAYTVRPDIWPPGTWVRLDPYRPAGAMGLTRLAMFANRVILPTMEIRAADAEFATAPGVAETLVLQGRTEMIPEYTDPGPWHDSPGLAAPQVTEWGLP